MFNIHAFFLDFNWKEIISSFWILFAVIDIMGNVPLIINIRKKVGKIHAGKTTLATAIIMLSFLLTGKMLLDVFSVDIPSFAIAGSIILLILGLEMVLDINIFKVDLSGGASEIVPLAFPILAGTGTLVTLLALKLQYALINILCASLGNLVLVYLIIHYSEWIEYKLGKLAISVIHKVMGVVLLSIAIKLFRTYLFAV